MAAKLEVRDLPDRLEYRVTEHFTLIGIALRMVVVAAFGAWWLYVARQQLMFFIFGLIGIPYGAYRYFRGLLQGTDVTLTVTERDVISDGYTQGEYFPLNCYRLTCPDFSFEDPNGEDDGDRPRGLYVGRGCVLPRVNETQALEIIGAIYSRFPDTASKSRGGSEGKSSGLTVLNLRGNEEGR